MVTNEPYPFEIDTHYFIPSNDYNLYNIVLNNEDENFNIPQQEVESEANNEISGENISNIDLNAKNFRTNTRPRKNPSWHHDYVMKCNDSPLHTNSSLNPSSNTKRLTSLYYPHLYAYFHSVPLTQTHKSF